MGFMDELRKLTQPYDDDDDFFEGADVSAAPAAAPATVSAAQQAFEDAFADEPSTPEPAQRPARPQNTDGGLFSALGVRRQARPKQPRRERTVSFDGNETQVILFNPKTFDEAGELVSHLNQNRSVVMTLEGLPTENARRLLDFLSGITYALQGKITPVSAKTYFVTPQNVDLVAPQADQPESDGLYF